MKVLNRSTNRYYGDVIAARLSRRAALAGAAGVWVAGLLGSTAIRNTAAAATGGSTLAFTELKRIYDQTQHVAPGYEVDVLLKWGDPLFADSPAFDHADPTPEQQLKAFGYNCDFIGFVPLPEGSGSTEHGLLCVNHEYISLDVDPAAVLPAHLDHAMADRRHLDPDLLLVHLLPGIVLGHVREHDVGPRRHRDGGRRPGRRARAAQDQGRSHRPHGARHLLQLRRRGHALGTILTCEEGVSDIFGGDPAALPEELRLLHERYGYDGSDYYGRARFEPRFRLDEEPHEPNRFDWVVEIDPYDPAATPMKRTALGRTSHEGATVVVNKDGRVVVYMGDDDYFEHIYRFVSAKPFDPASRAANRGLLDEGTLSVARFTDDGKLVWES